jgi:hypothetical protein
MDATIVQGLVWFALGSLTTALIAWIQSRASSKELQTVFRAFAELAEDRGWVEWQRDKKGTITTARVIRLPVHPDTARLTLSEHASVVKKDVGST